MAMAMSDSLYVAAPLLCDPAEILLHRIRRVLGNVGKAGVSLLIPPPHPMVRTPSVDMWNLINHEAHDGKAENSFQGTSMHLSLTEYRVPYTREHEGTRDIQVYFQEAVVSIYDRAAWVADVDILKALESKVTEVVRLSSKCPHVPEYVLSRANFPSLGQLKAKKKPKMKKNKKEGSVKVITTGNWFEFQDRPDYPIVVKARGKWTGQLAAMYHAQRAARAYYLCYSAGGM
jgi:hypothetical protein